MYPKHAIKHVHGFNANSALGFISGTRKFSQSKLLLRFRQDQLSYYIRGNGMYSLRSLSSNATTSSTSGKGTRITTTGFLEDIKTLWKKSLQIPNSPKRDGWIIGQEDIFLHVPRVHVFYRLAWLLRWVMLGVMTWSVVDTMYATTPNPNFNPYNPGSESPSLPLSTNQKITTIAVGAIASTLTVGISLRLRRRLVTTMAFRVDRLYSQSIPELTRPPHPSKSSKSVKPLKRAKNLGVANNGNESASRQSPQSLQPQPESSSSAAGIQAEPMVAIYTLEGKSFTVPLTSCRLVDLKRPGNVALEIDGYGKWVVDVEDAEVTYRESSKPVYSTKYAEVAKVRKDAKDTKNVIPPFKYVPEDPQSIQEQREVRNNKAKEHLLWLWYWETRKYPSA